MLAESIGAQSFNFGKSIKGLTWILEEGDERTIRTLCQKLDISEILARILCNRGITLLEEAENFLDPKLKNLIVDPFKLKDMDKAVERIISAIQNKEKVCVFGDYDVDGATSSALFRRLFKDIGIEVGVYIPNRLTEGYGPNVQAFDKLKEQGYHLVVTVDCGVVSFEPLAHAKKIGIDVVVIDHHLGVERLPEAVAVINPNRFDEDFPFKSMAAVGVTFMFAVALRTKLREINWFQTNNIKEPELLNYLDLVALGTVCDVMLLKGINRAFVSQGLKIIGQRKNVGLATLANVAKLDSIPKTHHLGYVFGPRINAGGRVGEGILGSDLLTTDCPNLAYEIAMKLERLNEDRRLIEGKALEEALAQIETHELYKRSIILVKSYDWHLGILGILASKIKEKYSKPSGVMVIHNGLAKGSARSIVGLDLGRGLALAKQEGLLLEGGGHAMAGGFTVMEEKIEKFTEYLENLFNVGNEAYLKAKELVVDHVLTIPAINSKLTRELAKASPFGNGNTQPKFVLANVYIAHATVVGADNVLTIVADKNSDSTSKTQKCMLFKGLNTPLGQFLVKNIGKKISLAGTLQPNNYDPEKIDFIIEDVSF